MAGTEAETNALEDLFRTRTTAHRLRLSQIYIEMAKDPLFTKEFPEFKPLVNKSKKTVTALLEHDASKGSAETAKAIRVLSLTQGLNYRDLPQNLSAEDRKLIRKTMTDAIDDLNTMDNKFMTEAVNKVSPGAKWTRAHDTLTETIDFYDTYKSRQAELAKNGKPLSPPSEWIEKLEAEGHYTEEEKKHNALKKRLAKYLEAKDPLSNPAKFAKAEDFTHLAKSSTFSADLEDSFVSKGKTLIKQAARLQKMQSLSRLASFGKAVPGSFALMYGLTYLASPETANATDALASFTMSSETSNCDSVKCHNFFKECAAKLKLKTIHQSEIAAHKDFPKCLADFFKLPLDKQTELRDDINLDRILNSYAPGVINLTCTANGTIAETEVIDDDHKILSHKIIFSETSTPAQILRDDPSNDFHDRLVYSKSKAQLFQHCVGSTNCKNYEINEMLDIKLGFWRDDKLPRFVSGPMEQVSINSFKWARKGHQLAENEADAVKNCCNDNSCQQFFTDRKNAYESARKKQIAVHR